MERMGWITAELEKRNRVGDMRMRHHGSPGSRGLWWRRGHRSSCERKYQPKLLMRIRLLMVKSFQ